MNVSSAVSSRGLPFLLYPVSRGASDQITRCLAVQLGPHNIRVNSVNPILCPDSPMGSDIVKNMDPVFLKEHEARVPLRRYCAQKEVVHAILYLLSEKAGMVNGAFLPVDGGVLCT